MTTNHKPQTWNNSFALFLLIFGLFWQIDVQAQSATFYFNISNTKSGCPSSAPQICNSSLGTGAPGCLDGLKGLDQQGCVLSVNRAESASSTRLNFTFTITNTCSINSLLAKCRQASSSDCSNMLLACTAANEGTSCTDTTGNLTTCADKISCACTNGKWTQITEGSACTAKAGAIAQCADGNCTCTNGIWALAITEGSACTTKAGTTAQCVDGSNCICTNGIWALVITEGSSCTAKAGTTTKCTDGSSCTCTNGLWAPAVNGACATAGTTVQCVDGSSCTCTSGLWAPTINSKCPTTGATAQCTNGTNATSCSCANGFWTPTATITFGDVNNKANGSVSYLYTSTTQILCSSALLSSSSYNPCPGQFKQCTLPKSPSPNNICACEGGTFTIGLDGNCVPPNGAKINSCGSTSVSTCTPTGTLSTTIIFGDVNSNPGGNVKLSNYAFTPRAVGSSSGGTLITCSNILVGSNSYDACPGQGKKCTLASNPNKICACDNLGTFVIGTDGNCVNVDGITSCHNVGAHTCTPGGSLGTPQAGATATVQ